VASSHNPHTVAEALLDGFVDRFRHEIKERLLAAVMPDIDAAADAAFAGFKIAVERQGNFFSMEEIVKVVLEKKDAPRGN
jgi:hypothetical protein